MKSIGVKITVMIEVCLVNTPVLKRRIIVASKARRVDVIYCIYAALMKRNINISFTSYRGEIILNIVVAKCVMFKIVTKECYEKLPDGLTVFLV